MADVHTKEVRSFNMSRIRSKDTKPEMIVRKTLFANGFRYRLHDNKLPGKPDIVLKKYKTVIFIHGCFWHAHSKCKYFTLPKTRTRFWRNKLAINKANDVKAVKSLRKEGWRVLTIWECALKSYKMTKTLNTLLGNLIVKQ